MVMRADDLDVNAGFGLFGEMANHLGVTNLQIIDDQFFFRALDQLGQPSTRICRADYQVVEARLVGPALYIAFKQFDGFGHDVPVMG